MKNGVKNIQSGYYNGAMPIRNQVCKTWHYLWKGFGPALHCTVNLIPPNVQTISDRICIMNQKISINKMWLFVWTNCVCWIKAALFIEEELPIRGYNLKKMGFWGKNLFPTRWMYLGYNMISMATLDYQKVVERLFHAWGLK